MRIGLIAGSGRFPFLALAAASNLGHEVTVVAIRGEADTELESAATAVPGTEIHWVSLGQLGRCITFLKEAGVSRALMAGQVKHTKLFAGLVPGPFTGLGPRGINRRGDLTFGRLPLTAILYMGTARKPGAI